MRRRHTLAAAVELKPLRQGDLSSLCGLYSVLNATQLALYPRRLRRSELQSLYRCAINHMSRRRQLKSVLGAGMDYPLWLELLDLLISHANRAYNTSLKPSLTLTGSAATNRLRAVARIKQHVWGGSPVLVCLSGALNHYTVICGYSDHRVRLFDSSGHHWIKANNLGLGEHSRRSHWIIAEHTCSIIDDW